MQSPFIGVFAFINFYLCSKYVYLLKILPKKFGIGVILIIFVPLIGIKILE
jgi:hypothetical protein